MDGMNHEQISCMGGFNAAHAEAVDFAYENAPDAWKPGNFSQKLRQPPAAGSVNFPPLLPVAAPGMEPVMGSKSCHTTPTGLAAAGQILGREATADERIENIMQHIQANGYESFDDLATEYYCRMNRDGDTTPLANEQHVRRDGRLAKVMNAVLHATNSWTHWERQSFYEEILKLAESMVASEAAETRDTVLSHLGPIVEASDLQNHATKTESLHSIKRTLELEVSLYIIGSHGYIADLAFAWIVAQLLGVEHCSCQRNCGWVAGGLLEHGIGNDANSKACRPSTQGQAPRISGSVSMRESWRRLGWLWALLVCMHACAPHQPRRPAEFLYSLW